MVLVAFSLLHNDGDGGDGQSSERLAGLPWIKMQTARYLRTRSAWSNAVRVMVVAAGPARRGCVGKGFGGVETLTAGRA